MTMPPNNVSYSDRCVHFATLIFFSRLVLVQFAKISETQNALMVKRTGDMPK